MKKISKSTSNASTSTSKSFKSYQNKYQTNHPEIQLHHCIKNIEKYSKIKSKLKVGGEIEEHERQFLTCKRDEQIYFVKSEFLITNNNYLRKLYLFYLCYAFLKFDLQNKRIQKENLVLRKNRVVENINTILEALRELFGF